MFEIDEVLSELTIEQKAALVTGADAWHTVATEALGVPAVMVADGPHGLRKHVPEADQVMQGESLPATCFPPAVTLGSTWDEDLVRRVGVALGAEARANEVAVLLGPGVNIKRSPLCGRNFEYLAEDPVLTGILAAAYVEGVQSAGVGTSLKHFAANNQETDRMQVSADIDERTLREIYLPAFEHVVRSAEPWTVMCAYNRVNGIHCSQNEFLLTQVLREEWGFEGLVVSDWGAVHDPVAALLAGLDLEMPHGPETAGRLVAAVSGGTLPEKVLDRSARRVLELVARAQPALADPGHVDLDAHHALALEAAAAGAVLLKNDADLLPLDRAADLVVIGELARTPRYQGGGSSHVNPTRVDAALPAIRELAGRQVLFAAGYDLSGAPDEALRADAVELARGAGTVLLFLGLPEDAEEEGRDRTDMDLPADQVALADAVAAVAERVVVVLANGSPVSLVPWASRVPAILEAWLGGQAGGTAIAKLLFGALAPSGRLAETLPLRLEDTPAYLDFPGELGHVRYGEGVFVGYRYYDARRAEVAFPFGHGLTYTTFDYADLDVTVSDTGNDVRVDVAVTVTNTGIRSGAEVVQVYVGEPGAQVARPPAELRAFAKIALDPAESRLVEVALTGRDMAYWHPVERRWVIGGGTHVVSVGASSRDLRASAEIDVSA